MALFGPARGPGFVVRLLQRLVSLRLWLRTALGLAMLGLVIVPALADLVNAVTKTAQSDEGSCRILNVIDGDTVTLMCGESGIGRAQIQGYDTPQTYAPHCMGEFLAAEQAAWDLRTLIRKADRIEIVHQGMNQDGPALVSITLDGIDLSRLMVRTGHARAYGGGPRAVWCL